MSKTFENDFIRVEYDKIDTSFDHELGTQKAHNYAIKSISIHCEFIDEFIYIKDIPRKLEDKIINAIEKEEN